MVALEWSHRARRLCARDCYLELHSAPAPDAFPEPFERRSTLNRSDAVEVAGRGVNMFRAEREAPRSQRVNSRAVCSAIWCLRYEIS
jgi:hypothetical protein